MKLVPSSFPTDRSKTVTLLHFFFVCAYVAYISPPLGVPEYFTNKTARKYGKKWDRRSLTPLGKIHLIKTFMISVFNHLFMSLPDQNQAIIDYRNNTIIRETQLNSQ